MKKIVISVILLFSVLLFYTTYASSFNFSAEPDQATVNPGDEISITLKISNIDAGTEGINVVETNLTYDKSIIEGISFVEKNNWKSTYNPNEGDLYGKLLYTKMVSGVTNDEEIGVLKVKIKSDLTNSFTTELKLSQVTSNDGYSLINVGDKTVKLSYKAPATPQPSPNPDQPSTDPTSTGSKTNTETKTDSVKQENASKSRNTQTGDAILYVSAILLVSLILFILLIILSKKLKDDEEKEKKNAHKSKKENENENESEK